MIMVSGLTKDDDAAIDIVESSDGTKFFIPHVDDDIKPKLHGKFKSLKEAEATYREYADKSDEVARRNYQEFGDVISFDGTFRTNLHCMIFVPFLAVDNHKSSVVVGSALINGETIDNFTWVLRAFLGCHGKQPVFIITDQCAAMRQAIPLVFTESKHRLCMWHIMNKVPGKVSVALKHNPEFNRVERNYSENTIDCQCKFFIRDGYLCRHALAVLVNDKVDRILDRYILRRWTTDLIPVQMQSAHVRYKEGDTEKENSIRDVYTTVDGIISRARNDKSLIDKLRDILRQFKVEVDTKIPYDDPSQQKKDAIQEHLGVAVPDEVDILPPSGIRNKGCGTGKRLISASEKVQKSSKKPKRKCAKCGQCAGHDSRNCPNV
ncbi:hypothetical protein L6452_32657 [Arctium lappa]|uniref:Uncharacterized protein n=1 Tax=Arctium lappa TaxID=4217 RepID=A0ACB8Z5E4_ARCLA|nr:hypothetical protein L6452_32657 [Arctium lappa]